MLVAVMWLFAQPAAAATTRVGFVDIQAAIEKTREYKKARIRFESKVKKEQGLIEARQKKFDGMIKEFQKQSHVLSPELKQKKEKRLLDEKKELERYVNDRKEDLMLQERQIGERILKKMMEVLKKIGKEKKYTMILEKRAVFYSDSSSDVTALATKTYDRINK